MTLGLSFLVLGPLGALAGGFLTRWWQARGEQDASLRVVCLGAVAFAASIASLALPAWTPTTILIPMALAVFSMAATQVVAMLVIQLATPNALRGRIAAAYFIVTNLIGAGLGPPVAAGLTQYLFHEPGQIGLSLATLALVAGPLIVLGLTLALEPFRMLLAARTTAA